MNRPTAGRSPLRAAPVAALLVLLTGCGAAPATPRHTGLPATAVQLCGLYTPKEVMDTLGIKADAEASPSAADLPAGVRWCDYRAEDHDGVYGEWIRIELRSGTRPAFDLERGSRLAARPEEGEAAFTEVPGIADGAIGAQGAEGHADLVAFHHDTRIMISASKAPLAGLSALVNRLISDTEVGG